MFQLQVIGSSFDVYVIQILSPQEMQPELAGDLRLVDVEDDDVADVTISAPLLKKYKATLETYCAQLHRFCTRRGAMALLASSETAVETLVLEHLRRRGLLR